MLYKTLSICLFFSLCSITYAQDSFTIKGSVVNANNLKPIENANIICKNLFAISSKTGEFIIKNVPKGSYTFNISHIGFNVKKVTVFVNSETEILPVYLEESNTTLQEVEIIAKSKQRQTKETPLVSYSVSKTFLDTNRENSLMQTLSKIPGVSTINIGSGQSKPTIRGLGFNRVAVVQNGIKHEAQQWGNDHGLEIDQQGIENIQIIKGPASLLYGSDAIAGVVDIQPNKTPLPNSFGGEVNILGESNNDLIGVSAGITTRKDKWFYRGRLTYRDFGDYKVPTDKINYENYVFELHEKNLRNTAGNEADASLGIGFVSEDIKSETVFSNVNAKNGFFANAHGLEVRSSSIDYDHSNRDIDLPFHKVNHFKITNNTAVSVGEHNLQIDLGYQNNNREEHSEPVPHGYMPTPPNTKERLFIKNTYSLNFRDAFKPTKQHDLVIGLNTEYQNNNIGGWGFLIPEYNRFTAGIFAYDQLELNSNFHVLAGLRYDVGSVDTKAYYDWYPSTINNNDGSTSYVHLQRSKDKTLNFGSLSASLGVSYIHNKTSYKINVGRSFRMPLANELASDGVNYHMYRYEKGNLELDPEISYQLDVDINHTTKLFSLGISPFVNIFQNYIYLNPTSSYYETIQIYEYTQAKVFRIGGELNASTKISKNLQLDASIEYVYSRQRSGEKEGFTLPFSPPLSGLLSAKYQFNKILFFKQPQLIADYRITAAQEEIVPPEEKTEGYQVLNMSFLADIDVFKNNLPIKIRAKLNNVFNTKYFNHTSFYRLIDVPEAGRNISLSLTVPF
ncbi:TonB-dependent receptor [Lacinutrix sp. C3R15]|uniref:TonB-dependent receptor n=1 Tax=Flavobacteriaceae TaxID=49546 RepID=UPI001C0818EE|nr:MULTISPECIES: TonB-dependent receptor [Flavobacteriaceae]MBU2938496.1 TonB-dependent receptor [Lacinutrix sp. C3R15]MDO6621810.1 TonB-dependent receptor [Oceanihabitans sp. 1_MG-2023]